MSQQFHVGEKGAAPCNAQPGKCPLGGEHFDTAGEAEKAYEAKAAEQYGENTSLKKSPKSSSRKATGNRRPMNENEKAAVSAVADKVRGRIENRASEHGEGITYDDANPERANRRLNEAIAYAEERKNEHLINSLSKARVLPSGAFKTADGKRVNTDAVLKDKVRINHVESERNKIISEMSKAANSGDLSNGKFSLKTDAGSFSATVNDSMDREAFDALDEKTKAKISSPKESLNLDAAREHLDRKTLHEITSRSQVFDVVIGKEPDVGKDKVQANTDLGSGSSDDKLNQGLKNMSDLYSTSAKEYGKQRDLKANYTEGTNAVKIAAGKKDGNTFIPARSQRNGGLVTERLSVNRKKAQELLSPEQLKKITVTRNEPDRAKAEKVLDKEKFDKVFGQKKVSVRVTESKE